MKLSNSANTSLATPLRKYWLQPLITGFISLIKATAGEPTCLRQRPLSFPLSWLMESWLGLISSL
jgi:hypothetical protein